uniref:Uncharacterized protein n=1 Tax=Coturnix japonica TaxID=93934 RepID=A0A8C2YEK1_COTJA
MFAHLALPLYQPYTDGSGVGYLDLYWNSVGEAGHAPASVGPAAAAASSSLSPESGEKRQIAGEDLVPKSEEEDEKVPEEYLVDCLDSVLLAKQPRSYLDVYPKSHHYPITAASNTQTTPTPCQCCRAYTIVTSKDGGVSYKGGGTCRIQQTVGFIAQHKVDFYHSYLGSVEYSCTNKSDGNNFHQSAPVGASLPATAGHHLYHS